MPSATHARRGGGSRSLCGLVEIAQIGTLRATGIASHSVADADADADADAVPRSEIAAGVAFGAQIPPNCGTSGALVARNTFGAKEANPYIASPIMTNTSTPDSAEILAVRVGLQLRTPIAGPLYVAIHSNSQVALVPLTRAVRIEVGEGHLGYCSLLLPLPCRESWENTLIRVRLILWRGSVPVCATDALTLDDLEHSRADEIKELRAVHISACNPRLDAGSVSSTKIYPGAGAIISCERCAPCRGDIHASLRFKPTMRSPVTIRNILSRIFHLNPLSRSNLRIMRASEHLQNAPILAMETELSSRESHVSCSIMNLCGGHLSGDLRVEIFRRESAASISRNTLKDKEKEKKNSLRLDTSHDPNQDPNQDSNHDSSIETSLSNNRDNLEHYHNVKVLAQGVTSAEKLRRGDPIYMYAENAKVGKITVQPRPSIERPMLDEYLELGHEIMIHVAIDFSRSNCATAGDSASFFHDGQSLHAATPLAGASNYVSALCTMLPPLLKIASSKKMTAFAYGCAESMESISPHIFPLTLCTNDLLVPGFTQLLDHYHSAGGALTASGPTLLSPLISSLSELVKKMSSNGSLGYHVVLVLGDGQLNDIEATCHELIQAAALPMSFVFVKIGSKASAFSQRIQEWFAKPATFIQRKTSPPKPAIVRNMRDFVLEIDADAICVEDPGKGSSGTNKNSNCSQSQYIVQCLAQRIQQQFLHYSDLKAYKQNAIRNPRK